MLLYLDRLKMTHVPVCLTKEHAVIPVYSGSDCNDFGDDFASPTKQYIYACQREQVGGLICASCARFGLMGKDDSWKSQNNKSDNRTNSIILIYIYILYHCHVFVLSIYFPTLQHVTLTSRGRVALARCIVATWVVGSGLLNPWNWWFMASTSRLQMAS